MSIESSRQTLAESLPGLFQVNLNFQCRSIIGC